MRRGYGREEQTLERVKKIKKNKGVRREVLGGNYVVELNEPLHDY